MARWVLNEAHTAAEFCVRHMMITYVRGHFKNIGGSLEFDPGRPEDARVEVSIAAGTLWSGEPERDEHLRSEDFLHVERHPTIGFRSTKVEPVARNEYRVTGDLAIRECQARDAGCAVPRPVSLALRRYARRIHGDYAHRSPRLRGELERGPAGHGVVVGDDVLITLDVEAEAVEEKAG